MPRRYLATLAAFAVICSAVSVSAHPRHYAHAHAAAPRVVVTPVPRIAPRCIGHECSATVTASGPHGNTVSRSGAAYCADGACTRSRSVTGPGGETRNRSISISR